MKDLLRELIFRDFEYVLIDSPPSMGVLTVNDLVAAEHMVIPMNPSLYSMQGTNDLMATVYKVRKNLNPELKLLGVIINSYDSIPVITRQIRDEIETSFGEKVLKTVLSMSIKIEEAIADRSGVIAKNTKVGLQIRTIVEELIERVTGSELRVSSEKETLC